jgi:hypothetical protein
MSFGCWLNISKTPAISVNRFIRWRRLSSEDYWWLGSGCFKRFLDIAGSGDVGPTITVAGDFPSEPSQELPRLEQARVRRYLSIFGEINIERICYGHDRIEAAPLDAQLQLPRR